jgi:hypothetical protein
MSGMDELNKKLVEMGANKAQLGSKVIPMMLSIFADAENAIDAYKALEELRHGAMNAENMYREAYHTYLRKVDEADLEWNAFRKWKEQEQAKIDQAREQLLQLETAEARDRLRLARVFEATVSPQNVYQQTEFIKGMAAILSGGKADGQTSE